MVTGGEGALPYIGKWLLSFGSLYVPQLKNVVGGISYSEMAPSIEITQTTTLGAFFTEMISKGYALEGDIFTIVRILTSADSAGYDEYTDETLGLIPGFTYTGTLAANQAPVWSIDQYIVNAKSAELLKDQRWTEADATYIKFDDMQAAEADSARAAAVIITRKTANGLLCSTSQLVWNKKGEDMMSSMASDAWLQGQRKAWSSQDVILAGALV